MDSSVIYIYERMPLILLFATGYILYRATTIAGLPEYMASRAVNFSRGRADLLLLSLIGISALLSMFIPNAVTVLAMVPVIRKLDHELKAMTTPLTLSIIYGANIGGMGSLIGSPANLLLLGALDLFNVPGRERITFFNWFEWSLPLVVLMLLLAWIVARISLPDGGRARVPLSDDESMNAGQRKMMAVFMLFLLFWSGSSMSAEVWLELKEYETLAALLFTTGFCGYIFGSKLLCLRDLLCGIPKRGLMFIGLLAILVFLAGFFKLDVYAADIFRSTLDLTGLSSDGFGLYLVTGFLVIILTEFLSNTVVSMAFFAVIVNVATAYSLNPLPLMVLVSTASTCAFMTPVATPCNSFAVGEMRGISMRIMLGLGLILNVFGALLLSLWIWWMVPIVYG
ncbi:SLC13 family permease [Maridesulfovibrio sp.]|uniref:SLC13 family permease n=1 Tax=Maridesulfovibrio sp. TaxID=2795000 RepID=UPI0029CA90F6|nr:SLC13 family permease [Maridesulfovibrio sp.]